MAKYTKVLQQLQELRLEKESNMTSDLWGQKFDSGFIHGINAAEKILYEEQEQSKTVGRSIWHTGSPNDIKLNNTGDYVLILKAHFDSDDGIEADHVYISQDYWNGTEWEGFEVGEDRWEVLYFAKLKWLFIPLPPELGMKKNDKMFIK